MPPTRLGQPQPRFPWALPLENGRAKKPLALAGHVSSHTTYDHKMPYKAQILCKTSQHAIKGRVHTWFPGTVPEYGTRWAQM